MNVENAGKLKGCPSYPVAPLESKGQAMYLPRISMHCSYSHLYRELCLDFDDYEVFVLWSRFTGEVITSYAGLENV
jgi:hypothetical protein